MSSVFPGMGNSQICYDAYAAKNLHFLLSVSVLASVCASLPTDPDKVLVHFYKLSLLVSCKHVPIQRKRAKGCRCSPGSQNGHPIGFGRNGQIKVGAEIP